MIDPGWCAAVVARARQATAPGAGYSQNTLRNIINDLIEIIEDEDEGVIEVPGPLSDEEVERLKVAWRDAQSEAPRPL